MALGGKEKNQTQPNPDPSTCDGPHSESWESLRRLGRRWERLKNFITKMNVANQLDQLEHKGQTEGFFFLIEKAFHTHGNNSNTIKIITENCFPCCYGPPFPEAATCDNPHERFQK